MADMTYALPHSLPRAVVQPGKSVRFAVLGDDGRRSMAWSVWTSRHTLDAYLTVRPLGGTFKFSLHQSGIWQSGITEEAAARLAGNIPSRHLDRWQRPDEFAPGMRRSLQVVIPDSELRRWPEGVTDDKPMTAAVPAPGVGNAACIEFVFMAGQPPMLLDFPEPIFDVAALVLHDGSALRVVSRQIPWPETDAKWLLASKTNLLATIDPERLRVATTPRAVFVGKHDDGTRYAVEAAGNLP